MNFVVKLALCFLLYVIHVNSQSLDFNLKTKFKNGSPNEIISNLTRSLKWNQVKPFLYDDAEIEKDIINYEDAQYYSTLYLGSNQDEFTFIFDTGSEWLWVPSDQCQNCRSSARKFTPSTSYKATGNQNFIQYLSGSVHGDIGTDEVRVIQGADPVNMKLMTVTSEDGIEGTVSDGIVGLTPAANNGSDLLITKLYKNKQIGENTFGLNINPSPDNSKIIIGGYDKTIVGENGTFAWVNLRSKVDWRVNLNKVKYNNQTLYAKGGIAVFDCGTSLTKFQTGIYYAILAELFQENTCFKIDNSPYEDYYGCQCDSYNDFANITFQLGGYDFTFANYRYIKEDVIEGTNVCIFMFQGQTFSDTADFVLLGANFFYDYYVYHDVSGGRIGLYGNYEEAPDYSSNINVSYMMMVIVLMIWAF